MAMPHGQINFYLSGTEMPKQPSKIIDIHTHFEGAIDLNALAEILYNKFRKGLVKSEELEQKFQNKFQHHLAKDLIAIYLKSPASQQSTCLNKIASHLKKRTVLNKPAKDLRDFISHIPTAFIRWTCTSTTELEYLITQTLAQFPPTHSYLEMQFSPFALKTENLTLEKVIEAFYKVSEDHKYKNFVKFAICLRREKGDLNSQNLAKLTQILRHSGISQKSIKIDIAGEESNYPLSNFTGEIRKLIDSGYELSFHIGETTDRDLGFALETFPEVKHYNHGIKILDHPELIKTARERNIHFATSPLSNYYSGAATKTEAKSLPVRFAKAGLIYSINSDDPVLLDRDLLASYSFAN
ncbi:hypothetical protein GF357_00810 [Candidatus Dojkabacteria bacterium]|nr:hypothetical protein [Candidatus Dojkabacteria bacterium]